MNTETKDYELLKFKDVVTELRIPENYNALPANKESTIEFIVEVY